MGSRSVGKEPAVRSRLGSTTTKRKATDNMVQPLKWKSAAFPAGREEGMR